MYFTSSSSPPFSQLTFEISKLKKIHSRRLLLHTPFYHPYASAPPPSGGASSPESNVGNSPFNANAFMVLAILLCALICTFGLHTIIRFALRTCARAGLLSGGRHSAVRMANTGIKKAALKTFSTVNYSAAVMAKVPGLASECVICLSEFAQGEKLKLLPKCNHGFHIRCIDKWLRSHSSCPTCRHCLLDTCKKIVGCSDNQPQAPTPTPMPTPTPTPTPALAPAPAPATLLPPLEHESVVISYRASC